MTEEPISKSELGNHLLGACDILRGPINQDEYKSYITPLLFFKRISDVYDEEAAEALEMSGGDEDYAALPENHSFAVPDGCHWRMCATPARTSAKQSLTHGGYRAR